MHSLTTKKQTFSQKEIPETLSYILDHDNLIIAIHGGWDCFAKQNAGEAVLEQLVIGQPWQNFVSGKVTQQYWRTVFEHVRSKQKPLSIDYRCDAPLAKRFMCMTVYPEPSNRLRLVSACRHIECRSWPVTMSRAKQRSKHTLTRCSQCNRLLQEGVWQEAEELVHAPAYSSFEVVYGICPACQQKLLSATQMLS